MRIITQWLRGTIAYPRNRADHLPIGLNAGLLGRPKWKTDRHFPRYAVRGAPAHASGAER